MQSKLHAELEKLKTIFLDNGYPEDVILSYTKEKIAIFSAVQKFGPQKFQVLIETTMDWKHFLAIRESD